MNPRLQAMLNMLDQHTRELKLSNDRYRATNDRFSAWLSRWTKDGKAPPEWKNPPRVQA